jgi:colicin import membrane protein
MRVFVLPKQFEQSGESRNSNAEQGDVTMADEETIETGSEAQSQQDAGTAGDDQDAGAADTGKADEGAAGSQDAGSDLKAEYEQLQQEKKELQSQFTTVSQEAMRTRQMLEAVQPYVDYRRVPGQQQAGQSAGESEGDEEETYLSEKQVKELVSNTVQEVRGEIIAQQVRSTYPDVCDNGWKEVIVRSELAKIAKTHPYEDAQQRIKRAVEATRTIIKGVQDEGRKEAETERQKADAEAKKKAAAATAAPRGPSHRK